MKNTTARLFMLLASVLMLKICFGLGAFVSNLKASNTTYVYAADSQKNAVLNVANTEFDEDENEENKTEDFFVELHHLNIFFQIIQIDNQLLETVSCYQNYTNNISIYKTNNCFRI